MLAEIFVLCVAFVVAVVLADLAWCNWRLRRDLEALKVKWGQFFAAHESRLDALEARAGTGFIARMADRDREEPRRVS